MKGPAIGPSNVIKVFKILLLIKKGKEMKFNEKIGCDTCFYNPNVETMKVAKNTKPKQRE